MYHKIEQADLSALEAIAPGRVFAGGQISEDYGHDELGGVAHMPEVLVRVDGTDEVSSVLRPALALWGRRWRYMAALCSRQPE